MFQKGLLRAGRACAVLRVRGASEAVAQIGGRRGLGAKEPGQSMVAASEHTRQ
jgi:hypothetical protein